MKKVVIIVAGGKGTRMKAKQPKQFLVLNGLPIIMHTIRRFIDYDANIEVRVVLPADTINDWTLMCTNYQFDVEHQVIAGGENRFDSVTNGIRGLSDNCIVAIHDGVRPLVSQRVIAECFRQAEEMGAVIPVTGALESIRKVDNVESVAVDRDKYVFIQTPQVFKSSILLDAYDTLFDPLFTDDATVVERKGYKVHLVEGNRENIKITTPTDLLIAEVLQNQMEAGEQS